MSPTPLELLLSGRFQELLILMRNPGVRGELLAGVAGSLGPLPGVPGGGAAVLAERQLNMLASGDWSWGILTPRQRREFLVRDVRLLAGSGTADKGAAQLAALKRLKSELGNLYDSLKLALREGDLAWLLPLAENLASILEFTSEYASMLERYGALLLAGQQLGSPRLELHARLGLSLAATNLGMLQEAQAHAVEAVTIAKALSDEKLEAAGLHLGGTALAMSGEYAAARDLLGRALGMREEQGERHGVVASMSNLAYVEEACGNRMESKRLLEEALEVCRGLGDRRGEAMFLQNLGSVAYGNGDYASARELAGQALCIYQQTGERRGVASALNALGFAEYGAGNFWEARALLKQALEECRELGDRNGESLALLTLGALDYLDGEFKESSESFSLALEVCQASGDRQGEARANCGLAQVARQLGRRTEAAQLIACALTTFCELDEKPGVVDCLLYAARLLADIVIHQECLTARDNIEQASLCLAGAKHHAAALRHAFDRLDQTILVEATQALMESARADKYGADFADDISVRAAAMTLQEHTELVLTSLAQIGA